MEFIQNVLQFSQNASATLESLNLTLIYSALIILGVCFCGFAFVVGGDDGGGIGAEGDIPGLVISPTGLAFCSTCFGAFGLILYHGFDMAALPSMLLAVVLALIMMVVFNYVFFKVFVKSGATVNKQTLEGIVGEVYTAIPAKGTGEIIYRDSMGRQKSPAREINGQALATGTSVVIKSALGPTLVVEASSSATDSNTAKENQK